jgi:branched-chain amino acid transport system permease protein
VWPAVALFGFAALFPVFVRDAFFLDCLILILLWGAVASAWNVAGGYAGQVSLGHSVFFGLGAYSAALLGTKWSVSPWIALVVGAALATVMGVIIGFLSNRLRGPYFVLATIAFSQVFLIIGSRWRGFTSGSEGIAVPFRAGFWTLGLVDKRVWAYLMLALAVGSPDSALPRRSRRASARRRAQRTRRSAVARVPARRLKSRRSR